MNRVSVSKPGMIGHIFNKLLREMTASSNRIVRRFDVSCRKSGIR